jgi:hypothetical protein
VFFVGKLCEASREKVQEKIKMIKMCQRQERKLCLRQAKTQRRGVVFPLPKGIKMRQRQERKLSLRQAKAQKGGIKDRRQERKLNLRQVKTGRRGVMFPLPKGVKS